MAYIKAPCGGIKLNDSQFKVDKDGIISSEGGGGGAVNSDATTLGGHAVDYFASAQSVTTLDNNVTNLSKNVTELTGKVTNATNNINTMSNNITDMTKNINDLTTNTTQLDNDIARLDTVSKNTIKGDYLGTDSLFIDLTKSESGVKINITPITNIEDATTPEDMVTKFNTLLSELKTMGIM